MATDRRSWASGAGFAAEATPVPQGREEVSHVPLLASHKGTQPDLILRWNDMRQVPAEVDVVVHLHGYSCVGEDMSLVIDQEPRSGLDFSDPDAPATPGRAVPTLGLLPRGSFGGGRRYTFPALTTRTGLDDLVHFGLERFGRRLGVRDIRVRRRILTAHSGGGQALVDILVHSDPDEVH